MDGEHSIRITLPDHAATYQLGKGLGQHCPPGTVLLLYGNLGSGKTTLVQGLGAGLGILDPISSPTFTLVNEYLEGRIPLYHVDLYRLSPAEVDPLGLDRYGDEAENTPGIVAIEWAERLAAGLPDAITVYLTYGEPNGRQAILTAPTPAHLKFLTAATDHGLLVNEV
ncbi:MAG: tRNA (adenosine(37)-N6)-threonylcarbamoyltransferase complex ATPase subunit type 1 TsaE [Nodosilinea sp.]